MNILLFLALLIVIYIIIKYYSYKLTEGFSTVAPYYYYYNPYTYMWNMPTRYPYYYPSYLYYDRYLRSHPYFY